MFRRLSAFALALLLAGCAATPAPESAAATATPSPSAALTQTPGRCPTYDEAMAAAAGPGETGEGAYTDADACLQNAYALAAALCHAHTARFGGLFAVENMTRTRGKNSAAAISSLSKEEV